MIFRVIARPSPVPVRRVVKKGSKMRGRSSAAMPAPRSLMSDPDPARRRRLVDTGSHRGVQLPAGGLYGVPGIGQDVHEREAQPLGIGHDRRQTRATGPGLTRAAAAVGQPPRRAASAHSALMSTGASVELDRPGEIEDLGDDAVEPLHFLVDVVDGRPDLAGAASLPRSDRSVVLMIISGLRISCATTVDSRPSDESRSRCAASRWKRAIESVIELNDEASSRASSSSQRDAGWQRDAAGQVAGRRHLAHRVGHRAERPRDRARDRVARQGRGEHRGDRHQQERSDAPRDRNCSRSVRDRRMIAVGAGAPAAPKTDVRRRERAGGGDVVVVRPCRRLA